MFTTTYQLYATAKIPFPVPTHNSTVMCTITYHSMYTLCILKKRTTENFKNLPIKPSWYKAKF